MTNWSKVPSLQLFFNFYQISMWVKCLRTLKYGPLEFRILTAAKLLLQKKFASKWKDYQAPPLFAFNLGYCFQAEKSTNLFIVASKHCILRNWAILGNVAGL